MLIKTLQENVNPNYINKCFFKIHIIATALNVVNLRDFDT